MIYCVVARRGDSHSQTGANLPRDALPEQECMGASAVPSIIISLAEIDSVAAALGLTGFPVEPTPPADDSTPVGEVPASDVAPPLEQNEVVNPAPVDTDGTECGEMDMCGSEPMDTT